MTPKEAFYNKEDNFTEWSGAGPMSFCTEITPGYGCLISTGNEGVALLAFAVPGPDNLGYGDVYIPLNVPERKGRKKYTHPLKDHVEQNRQFFTHTGHLQDILKTLGVHPITGMRGDFSFSARGTIEGDWFLVVTRQPGNKISDWRNKNLPGKELQSAVGLANTFAHMYEGWTVRPLPPLEDKPQTPKS